MNIYIKDVPTLNSENSKSPVHSYVIFSTRKIGIGILTVPKNLILQYTLKRSSWRDVGAPPWRGQYWLRCAYSLTFLIDRSTHSFEKIECLYSCITMDFIIFDDLPPTEYPPGTYVILHHGRIPPSGFVLSQIKVVKGWPNPVLESSRREGAPTEWLNTVDKLSQSKERPQFNMGVYQVEGKNMPAALYGPLEVAHPLHTVLFQNQLSTFPEEMKHLAHLF